MGLDCRKRRRISDAFRIVTDDRGTRLRLCRLFGALLRLRLFFRTLLLVRTLQEDPCLERLFHQVRAAAFRAFCRDRLVVRREVALGIVGAAPEDIAAACLALCNIANTALRAL